MSSNIRNDRVSHTRIQESINQCIENVSQSSRYQHKLIIFFTLTALFSTMQYHNSPLIYMNPVFHCQNSDVKVFEDDACNQLQFCTIINTGTVTAQLQLYCDSRKNDRILLQTGIGLGSCLGLFFSAWSDRLGKKFNFCLTILLLNLAWIFQFIGAHEKNITLLFIAEIISGFSHKSFYIAFIVLLTRFMKKADYEFGTVIWFVAYHGLSQMAISGLNAIYNNWRIIAYVYSIGILGCAIASLLILKEDPLFLFDVGKIADVRNIIQEVGRQNGTNDAIIKQNLKKINELFDAKMRMIKHEEEEHQSKFDLNEIMRCDIIQKVIIIGLVGCFYLMASLSISLYIQSLEFSFNFNLFIVGLSNMLGFMSAIYIIKVQPHRKRGVIYSSLICASVAMLFLFPFCNQNGSVQTVVIFILRIFLCWSCTFYTRLKVDSFPEKYQMTLIGMTQFVVNFGLITGPTLIQLSVNHQINPILSIGILRLIFGTLPVFFFVEQKVHLRSKQKQKIQDKAVKELNIFQLLE